MRLLMRRPRSLGEEIIKKNSGTKNADRFNKEFAAKGTLKNDGARSKNIILGQNLYFDPEPYRNANVLVIGDEGTGKTKNVVLPNILQMNSSYVVIDPKGDLFRSCGKVLLENGYDVKIFSTLDPVHSNCYNPFDYLYDKAGNPDESKVKALLDILHPLGKDTWRLKNSARFAEEAKRALLHACIMYILEFYPEERRNLYELAKLLQKGANMSENSEHCHKTEIDKIFEEAGKRWLEAKCVQMYKLFQIMPTQHKKEAINDGVDLFSPFTVPEIRNLTSTSYVAKYRNLQKQIIKLDRDDDGKLIRMGENLGFENACEKRTCIFVQIPPDSEYGMLSQILIHQMLEVLHERVEDYYPERYSVVDQNGVPLLPTTESEQEALFYADMYKNACVEDQSFGGKSHFYIVNKSAPSKYCIPWPPAGTLRETYSREAGEHFLSGFQNCSIKKGTMRLPMRLQFVLDGLKDTGYISELPRRMLSMRKYGMSCLCTVKTISDIKNVYQKLYADILSSCDMIIYLGSSDQQTKEYVVRMTIARYIVSQEEKRRKKRKKIPRGCFVDPDPRIYHDPIIINAIEKLDQSASIVLTDTKYQFIGLPKYDTQKHPMWEKTEDADPENALDPSKLIWCSEKSFAPGTLIQLW